MPQKNYILLHGAWHGSWCWKYIVPELTAQGHTVMAPDLPGHGENTLPFEEITLATYVDYVSAIMDKLDQPVTLVGHSMAGIILSQLGENIPDQIAQLIYVSAFAPENNESLRSEAKKSADLGVSEEMIVHKLEHRLELKISERLIGLFYNACDWHDANFALTRLQAEPSQPFIDPITISAENFGRVDKKYITCLHDHVIPPEDQARMYSKLNCELVELQTDHSPFLSDPAGLLRALA